MFKNRYPPIMKSVLPNDVCPKIFWGKKAVNESKGELFSLLHCTALILLILLSSRGGMVEKIIAKHCFNPSP